MELKLFGWYHSALVCSCKMTGPVETSSKRRHRIENKKKKMAALLDIVKLNENDRLKVKTGKAGDFVATPTEPLVREKCFDNSHSPSKKLKTER